MKTLLISLSLFLPNLSLAQIVPFDYTGTQAEYTNYESIEPVWGPGSEQPDTMVDPTAQWQIDGIAQQFTLTSPTSISALDINANIGIDPLHQSNSPGTLSTTLTWDIYSKSTNKFYGQIQNSSFPDYNSLLLQSDPQTFTINQGDPLTNIQEQIPFDITLQPGTYWLAEQGYGEAEVFPTQEYVDPVTAAEPSPLIMFIVGIFSFLLLNRLCPYLRYFGLRTHSY